MVNSIRHLDIIYKCLRSLNLCQVFSHMAIHHVITVLISTFSLRYKGKSENFSSHSPCHRTTQTHLLCCVGTGEKTTFKAGYVFFQNRIREEQVTFIYQCGSHQVPLEDVLALAR